MNNITSKERKCSNNTPDAKLENKFLKHLLYAESIDDA